MKIAICNVQEFNPTIGGIERVSVSLAEQFIKNGVDVIFISCRKSSYRIDYELPARQYTLPDSSDYSQRNCEAMSEIIRNEHVDILLNQNAHSLRYNCMCAAVKRLCGVKLISVLHFCPDMRIRANRNLIDVRFFSFAENIVNLMRAVCTYWPLRPITMRGHRKLYEYTYETSDRVVLLSDKFYDDYTRIGNIRERTKLRAVNNILSFPYEPLDMQKKKRILFCGRLTAEKVPYRVLYIWQRLQNELPDWELSIVGDGPWRGKMQVLCDKLSLERVVFYGFKDPRPFYREAPILWMTSNHEGWGLVLTESMQYGCIPIAYDSFASIADIIESGKNGYLIEPFDTERFADRTLSLIRSDALYDFARAAHKSVERFKPESIVNQWIRIFNELLYE